MKVVASGEEVHGVVGNHRTQELQLTLGEPLQGTEKRLLPALDHRIDAGCNAWHILRLETVQERGILAPLLEVVDKGFRITLYFSINQTYVDVFLQEVVRKLLHSVGGNLERFPQIALQGVDALAAPVEVTLHLSEEGLQLKVVVAFLKGITVVYCRHQGSRAAQSIA